MGTKSVNRVTLIGNLGQDPVLRNAGETPVCNFSIATSDEWKNKAGEDQSNTEWHNIVAWRGLAEVCGTYLTKGSKVFIEGKLQTRKWEKDGVARYTTEIVIKDMIMLGGGSNGKRGESVPMPDEPPIGQNEGADDIPF